MPSTIRDSANNSSAFDDDLDTGDLRLWVDGELVMHLDVLERVGVQYDRWTAFGVSVLRPGSWMLRLNELAARLRIADEPYGEKAKNIELYKCNTAADGKGNE